MSHRMATKRNPNHIFMNWPHSQVQKHDETSRIRKETKCDMTVQLSSTFAHIYTEQMCIMLCIYCTHCDVYILISAFMPDLLFLLLI